MLSFLLFFLLIFFSSKVQWWNLINRSLPFPWLIILANGLWTTAVVLCIELLPGTEVSNFLREAQFMEAIGITTFFLSIALGFRLNQAYQRWWEARMLWGRMINRCRQLSFQSLTYIEEPNLALRICLWVLISSDLLRLHLRGRRELGLLQVIMVSNMCCLCARAHNRERECVCEGLATDFSSSS